MTIGALLLSAAVLIAGAPPSRGVAVRRLAALRHPTERGRGRGRRDAVVIEGRVGSAKHPEPRLRLVGAAGAALLALVLLGSAGWFVAAVAALGGGGVAWWALGRLEPAGRRRLRRQVVSDLPFAVDLFASCVAAGASTPGALRLAGAGVEGPVGAALSRASAALVLGASSAEAVGAWSLDPVLGPLAPLARTLVRSATSGTALVPAATRLATDLREARRWEVDAIARRIGVRATAPLGTCFLPAFVLLGIVPLVIAGGRAAGA